MEEDLFEALEPQWQKRMIASAFNYTSEYLRASPEGRAFNILNNAARWMALSDEAASDSVMRYILSHAEKAYDAPKDDDARFFAFDIVRAAEKAMFYTVAKAKLSPAMRANFFHVAKEGALNGHWDSLRCDMIRYPLCAFVGRYPEMAHRVIEVAEESMSKLGLPTETATSAVEDPFAATYLYSALRKTTSVDAVDGSIDRALYVAARRALTDPVTGEPVTEENIKNFYSKSLKKLSEEHNVYAPAIEKAVRTVQADLGLPPRQDPPKEKKATAANLA